MTWIVGRASSGFGACARDVQSGLYSDLQTNLFPGSLNLKVGLHVINQLNCSPDFTLDEPPLQHPVLVWQGLLVHCRGFAAGRPPARIWVNWKLRTPFWTDLELLSEFNLRQTYDIMNEDRVVIKIESWT
jgi:CTP-dependent riboflavin kinase